MMLKIMLRMLVLMLFMLLLLLFLLLLLLLLMLLHDERYHYDAEEVDDSAGDGIDVLCDFSAVI